MLPICTAYVLTARDLEQIGSNDSVRTIQRSTNHFRLFTSTERKQNPVGNTVCHASANL